MAAKSDYTSNFESAIEENSVKISSQTVNTEDQQRVLTLIDVITPPHIRKNLRSGQFKMMTTSYKNNRTALKLKKVENSQSSSKNQLHTLTTFTVGVPTVSNKIRSIRQISIESEPTVQDIGIQKKLSYGSQNQQVINQQSQAENLEIRSQNSNSNSECIILQGRSELSQLMKNEQKSSTKNQSEPQSVYEKSERLVSLKLSDLNDLEIDLLNDDYFKMSKETNRKVQQKQNRMFNRSYSQTQFGLQRRKTNEDLKQSFYGVQSLKNLGYGKKSMCMQTIASLTTDMATIKNTILRSRSVNNLQKKSLTTLKSPFTRQNIRKDYFKYFGCEEHYQVKSLFEAARQTLPLKSSTKYKIIKLPKIKN